VLEGIYDRFVTRLTEAVKSIKVGFSESPDSYMGPVVDEEACNRLKQTLERNASSATLLFQGEVPSEGYFVPPTVFADVPPSSELAQDEFFGPILAIVRVKNMNEAIEVVNDVDYGLTGGIYSRSPENIERAKAEIEVGNFYVNRSITGAMVDRHPFGGFKMSGLGSKTGGPDYLLQFMEPRVVTENTMRRGFAPSE
jgi:RHH-type proline utilization regulon transcriptional repressor/proline dehydrogenase/delta 1-pyrroline-5-carboxylate dehydrogenase